MLSRRMPFKAVPCSIWLPVWEQRDAYGNSSPTYYLEPDLRTECCYAPGDRRPDTADDIEDGRPYGAEVALTLFFKKSLDTDLRHAVVELYPPTDKALSGQRFEVVGEPYSYPRENTPGDYSWCVKVVRFYG